RTKRAWWSGWNRWRSASCKAAIAISKSRSLQTWNWLGCFYLMSEIRTGLGWDVHRLVHGRKLLLAGVEIPSELGLESPSDADILFHAVTDAILGAAALGDIGMHFPDSDPKWKGASSDRFLKHAVGLAAEHGFRVVNVDTTVILERPKLKDYRDQIRDGLA